MPDHPGTQHRETMKRGGPQRESPSPSTLVSPFQHLTADRTSIISKSALNLHLQDKGLKVKDFAKESISLEMSSQDVVSHSYEKRFICNLCQKTYARKSHLKVHFRVHTGERPFVCENCGKDFTEKRFLKDHMKTPCGVGMTVTPLKCFNCYREFAYKTSLQQHLKKHLCAKNIKRIEEQSSTMPTSQHASKQFTCSYCDKSYSWKQTLKQHVLMFHKNKEEMVSFGKLNTVPNQYSIDEEKDLWSLQLGAYNESESSNVGCNRMSEGEKQQSGLRNLAKKSLKLLSKANQSQKFNLADIKSENAVKRTQNWLAQLGRYQEDNREDKYLGGNEYSRNHLDDLWQQQISAARKYLVTPSSPITITKLPMNEEYESYKDKCTTENVFDASNPSVTIALLPPSPALSSEEETSVLKSLLTEPSRKRKRIPSTEYKPDGICHDILRKRLLGIVTDEHQRQGETNPRMLFSEGHTSYENGSLTYCTNEAIDLSMVKHEKDRNFEIKKLLSTSWTADRKLSSIG